MNQSPNIVLGIESGVAGGSFTLLKPGCEPISFSGTGDRSRAESILGELDAALKENAITITEIGHIAVSAGPGSFTGIRIGFSTAMGLAAALNVRLSSHSILLAMASMSDLQGDIAAAIPMGRGSVALQCFFKAADETEVMSNVMVMSLDAGLMQSISGSTQLIAHASIRDLLQTNLDGNTTVRSLKALSEPLARFSLLNPEQCAEPIFVSRDQG